MPELVRARDAEVPGPPAAIEPAAALNQAALAHHAQDALAVDGAAELAANERADHPVAVGLVGLRDLHDRGVDLASRRALSPRRGRPGLGNAVDRLAADRRHA